MRCVPVRIPNSNSKLFPNLSKVSSLSLFRDGNILVLIVKKVPVVRHSAIRNSKFQILDGADLEIVGREFLAHNLNNPEFLA
jgi:hypothetical protein